MSLPTKTGVPDGLPSGDPPGGSPVTPEGAPSTTEGSYPDKLAPRGVSPITPSERGAPSFASMIQSSYDLPGGACAATGLTVSASLSRLTVPAKAGEAASFCRIATYSRGADRLLVSRATNPIASTPAKSDAAIAMA